jgi:replication factor A1
MQQSYDLLIERIAKFSGLEKEEVDRRVEAKRAKLSGLISKEGAAQIIAAELGVNFDSVQLKISELLTGMKKVNLVAKVINIFPVREYDKNGKKGKVANLIAADETGNIKIVLWDTNHIQLVENGEIINGVAIEIRNASLRNGELHLSGFSDIKKSNLILENVKTTRQAERKKIEEIQEGKAVEIRALIVGVYPPRFFFVCPECGKKAVETGEGHFCNEHGKVLPEERALINFSLDDGTGTIRCVLFSEQLSKLVNQEDLKDISKLAIFREDLLGTEFLIKANAKRNQMFNEVELSAFDMEKIDVEKLIEELEKG